MPLLWELIENLPFFSGIAAWMMTWKGVHVNGRRQVLREVIHMTTSWPLWWQVYNYWNDKSTLTLDLWCTMQASLVAVAVGLALSGKPVREAGEIVIIIIMTVAIIVIIMIDTIVIFIIIFNDNRQWFTGLTEMTDLQLEKRIWMEGWALERATLGTLYHILCCISPKLHAMY